MADPGTPEARLEYIAKEAIKRGLNPLLSSITAEAFLVAKLEEAESQAQLWQEHSGIQGKVDLGRMERLEKERDAARESLGVYQRARDFTNAERDTLKQQLDVAVEALRRLVGGSIAAGDEWRVVCARHALARIAALGGE